MVTQERLRELFDYDPTTGRLVRKGPLRPGEKRITYGKSKQGYFIRWVDRVCYTEHQLVYLFHHGESPDEIDHKNRIKTDNRIENLRPCNRTSNNGNQPRRVDNKSGFRGVSWHTGAGKWVAQITCNGEHHHLGLHNTKEDAARAYNEASVRLFGKFAHVNEVM